MEHILDLLKSLPVNPELICGQYNVLDGTESLSSLASGTRFTFSRGSSVSIESTAPIRFKRRLAGIFITIKNVV